MRCSLFFTDFKQEFRLHIFVVPLGLRIYSCYSKDAIHKQHCKFSSTKYRRHIDIYTNCKPWNKTFNIVTKYLSISINSTVVNIFIHKKLTSRMDACQNLTFYIVKFTVACTLLGKQILCESHIT